MYYGVKVTIDLSYYFFLQMCLDECNIVHLELHKHKLFIPFIFMNMCVPL